MKSNVVCGFTLGDELWCIAFILGEKPITLCTSLQKIMCVQSNPFYRIIIKAAGKQLSVSVI